MADITQEGSKVPFVLIHLVGVQHIVESLEPYQSLETVSQGIVVSGHPLFEIRERIIHKSNDIIVPLPCVGPVGVSEILIGNTGGPELDCEGRTAPITLDQQNRIISIDLCHPIPKLQLRSKLFRIKTIPDLQRPRDEIEPLLFRIARVVSHKHIVCLCPVAVLIDVLAVRIGRLWVTQEKVKVFAECKAHHVGLPGQQKDTELCILVVCCRC